MPTASCIRPDVRLVSCLISISSVDFFIPASFPQASLRFLANLSFFNSSSDNVSR